MDNLGAELYQGSASLGKAEATITLVVCIVISAIFFFFGHKLYDVKQPNMDTTYGTVTKSQCTPMMFGKQKQYQCTISVNYVVNGTKYSVNTSSISDAPYVVGQAIEMSYEIKNPSVALVKQLSIKTVSYVLFGIGMLILLGGVYRYYLASHSTIYAAETGALSLL